MKKCKKHGELKESEIYLRKDGRPSECRLCIRERDRLKNIKRINRVKNTTFLQDLKLEKICKRHGILSKEQIYVDKKYGYLSCKKCKSLSRKLSVQRYKAKNTYVEKSCEIHGALSFDNIYICKSDYPICRSCYYEKRHLKRHGLDRQSYLELLESQDNVCKICGGLETKRKPGSEQMRRMSVDHNHKTGEIRGILCSKCNTMIGLSLERPDVLRKAAVYIETGGLIL